MHLQVFSSVKISAALLNITKMGSRFRTDSPRSRTGYSEITDDELDLDDFRSWSSDSDAVYYDQQAPSSLSPAPLHHPKDPRTKAKYNIFSRLFFIWLEPLFCLGYRKELNQNDLYVHPSETDSEKLLKRFNHFWSKELERKNRGLKARLWVAVAKCFWWRLLVQGLSIVLEVAILIAQSIMLGDLSEYFGITDPTIEDTRDAYLYALGLILLSVTVVVLHSHSFLMGQKMSMITRIITTAAIYQKILSLNQLNIGQVSVGHVVNLASNDVQRFEPAFPHLPYVWVTPLHLIVFTAIVYQEVGWSVFLAAGFILLQIPLQIVLARLFVYLRLKSALVTDDRIRIMNEIIAGIRVIKMYAWELAFNKKVSQLRKKESQIIFKGALIRACNLAYMIVSISIIMWLMLSVYVGAGGVLSTKQVFTTLSLLTSLRLSSYFFVLAILGISEGKVAFSRIQNLLEVDDLPVVKALQPAEEFTDDSAGSIYSNSICNKQEERAGADCDSGIPPQKAEGMYFRSMINEHSLGEDDSPAALVRVENLSVSWSYEAEKAVFFDLNFEVNHDIPLLAVVGAVGTGKSTLLQCLLGELKPLEGCVEVIGRISYASQEPWVFTGTLRDNVLFGTPYISERYNAVIEACSLNEDIIELADGDLTEVGERGVALSGGQRARVNLARAIYRDADIYILDDPLSAVDVSVAAHLFNDCIRGLLGDRLVVLVTHQLQFALQADKILVIKEGCQEVYGSHEELLDQGIDPNYLLGLIRDEDELDEEERDMFDYKLIYDAEPPSPTTLSLLSLVDENGRITPYSFGLERPGSLSTLLSDGHVSVTTPLALYGHSMNDVNGSPFDRLHYGDGTSNGLQFPTQWERTSPDGLPEPTRRLSPPPTHVRSQESSPTEFQKKIEEEDLQKSSVHSVVNSAHRLSPTGFPFPKRMGSGFPHLVPKRFSPIPGSPVMTRPKPIGKESHLSIKPQGLGRSVGHPLTAHNLATHQSELEKRVTPLQTGAEKKLPPVSSLVKEASVPVGHVKVNGGLKLPHLALRARSPPIHAVNPLITCIPPTPPLTSTNNSQIASNGVIKSTLIQQVVCNPPTPPPSHAGVKSIPNHDNVTLPRISISGQEIIKDTPEIACIPPTPPIVEANVSGTFTSPVSPSRKFQQENRLHVASPSGRMTPTSLLLPPVLPRSGLTSPLSPRRARRSPTPSPMLMKKTHQEEEHIHPTTLEAARFDAASIYSGRSMVSLPGSVLSVVRENEVFSSESQQQQKIKKRDGRSTTQSAEDKGQGTMSLRTYYTFFRAGGSFMLLLAVLIVFVLGEVSVVLSDWWLSDWADCSTLLDQLTSNDTLRSTCSLSNGQRIGIYSATTLIAIILNFSRAILFYFLCLNASHVLHNRMFAAILKSPLLFFDNNPVGRVLNRFSKDVGYLDDLLPYTFCEYLLLLLRCLAVIIMAVASNVWLIIPASFLIVMFLALRWYYLKTSRDVKRLEAVARSPLYSHISTTLAGLSTIRAFSREQMSMEEFHKHQNEHSQGWYLYLVTVRWFGLRIDLLSTLFLATVALISVPLASQLNAGLVGLGLTYTISLADMLQYTIRLSADVENTMVSAERIMAYGRLEPEASLETLPPNDKPPSDWPDKGKITFEDVTFRYSPTLPLVVKDLCFTIKPSEKVGIVGRTGAGKSSLISVLYRLAEPFGVITIDDVDSKSIGLHDLRKKMSIIPQDPVLFSGTIRYNLDPFDEYSDAELWDALEQVQLKPVVQDMGGQLDSMVSEGGSNFSVGQRQLVCLARALLRKNKILVLDEATASVDQRTDEIIQKLIRENFSQCTVLTIAHRLNTIMDSDKIMLLKKGKLKEFDSPYKLLQDPMSRFYKMVEKTGPIASGKLHQMALEGYLRKTFRRHGRITPLLAKLSGKSLQTRSLLQRAKGVLPGFLPGGLSRIQERRPSIISSNSFPSALNEIGLGNPINSNDPNLQSLRLPSDPNVAASGDGDWQDENIHN